MRWSWKGLEIFNEVVAIVFVGGIASSLWSWLDCTKQTIGTTHARCACACVVWCLLHGMNCVCVTTSNPLGRRRRWRRRRLCLECAPSTCQCAIRILQPKRKFEMFFLCLRAILRHARRCKLKPETMYNKYINQSKEGRNKTNRLALYPSSETQQTTVTSISRF